MVQKNVEARRLASRRQKQLTSTNAGLDTELVRKACPCIAYLSNKTLLEHAQRARWFLDTLQSDRLANPQTRDELASSLANDNIQEVVGTIVNTLASQHAGKDERCPDNLDPAQIPDLSILEYTSQLVCQAVRFGNLDGYFNTWNAKKDGGPHRFYAALAMLFLISKQSVDDFLSGQSGTESGVPQHARRRTWQLRRTPKAMKVSRLVRKVSQSLVALRARL